MSAVSGVTTESPVDIHWTSPINLSNLLKIAGMAIVAYVVIISSREETQNLRSRVICNVVPRTIIDKQCQIIFNATNKIERDPTDYWNSGDSLFRCEAKLFNMPEPKVVCAKMGRKEAKSLEVECIKDQFPNSIIDEKEIICAEFA